MMNLWLSFANRVNGRSLRDRILILLAVISVVAAVGYFAVLAGTLDRKEKLRKQVAAKENEVGQTKVQVDAATKGQQDPDAASKARIAQLKRLMEETDAGVAKKRDRLVAPEKIPQLLEDMIAKQKSLILVRMNTVPVQSLLERKNKDEDDEGGNKAPASKAESGMPIARSDASKSAARGSDAGGPRGIFRHGVKIVVRGEYLELLAYLSALEKLPVQLFWKDLDIRVPDGADTAAAASAGGKRSALARTEMTVTLFTVSFDKIWLQV